MTHGPYEFGSSVPETWYVDPSTGKVEYAWTGSMIMVPEVIGRLEEFKLGGISILPRGVETQLGENRCLRVLGWGRDGRIQKELDVTERVKWKSADSAIAFIDSGRLISKKLGRTRVECELDGFMASIEISVEHIIRGQRTTYFQGLRRLQQIRFDSDDNLYICNQSASVYRLDKTGTFTEIIRLSTDPKAAAGVDSLAVDADKNLYVNDVSKASAFRFEWDGKAYVNPVEIGRSTPGTKKSMAIAKDGTAFVAVMGAPGQGWIVRREKDGKERSFPVNGMPIWLALGPENNLYVPIASESVIRVYRPEGEMVQEIPHYITDASTSDIVIAPDGSIYLAFFHSGKILQIRYSDPLWHAEFLAPKFGTPGGIAMDSGGRLFVSNSAGDTIDVVY